MRCLKPPLKKVPEGEWLCPGCNAGEAHKGPCSEEVQSVCSAFMASAVCQGVTDTAFGDGCAMALSCMLPCAFGSSYIRMCVYACRRAPSTAHAVDQPLAEAAVRQE